MEDKDAAGISAVVMKHSGVTEHMQLVAMVDKGVLVVAAENAVVMALEWAPASMVKQEALVVEVVVLVSLVVLCTELATIRIDMVGEEEEVVVISG